MDQKATRRKFLQAGGTLAAAATIGAQPLSALASAPVDELGFLSAIELAAKLRNKEIGSEELARYFIARIEQSLEDVDQVYHYYSTATEGMAQIRVSTYPNNDINDFINDGGWKEAFSYFN